MALVIAGIDEAGYGPVLGPLVVGCTAFRLLEPPSLDLISGAIDLWSLLAPAVVRTVREAERAGVVAFADSKVLKGTGLTTEGQRQDESSARHPLRHLERGVLCLLACLGKTVTSDAGLFRALDAAWPDAADHPCYAGEPLRIPLDWTEGERAVALNVFKAALGRARVEVVGAACAVLSESAFNTLVRRTETKASAPAALIAAHLRALCAPGRFEADDVLHVVCDRLGGRARYRGFLERALPGALVDTVEESDRRSAYRVRAMERELTISFEVESEAAHLAVGAASMAAKLCRELAMARFNRFWCAQMPELKPTAGYAQDGRRWLREARALSPADRAALVRIA